jgi:hypothetical protein
MFQNVDHSKTTGERTARETPPTLLRLKDKVRNSPSYNKFNQEEIGRQVKQCVGERRSIEAQPTLLRLKDKFSQKKSGARLNLRENRLKLRPHYFD